MKKHPSFWSLAALLSILSAACGDSTGPGTAEVSGRYELRSVNGATLPWLIYNVLGGRAQVTDGHIQVDDDGRCSRVFTVATSGTGQTRTDTIMCTWSRNGDAIFFLDTDGTAQIGSIIGDVLTLTSERIVFIYER